MKKQETDQGAPSAQSKLIIDRARWLRGEGTESTLLRPRDGKMCCLGFFGLTCGVPEKVLRATASPEDVPGQEDRWPSWLLRYVDERGYYRDTDACGELIVVNDSPVMPEPEREARIAAIFAKHRVVVEFVGDAAEPPHE